MIAAAMLRAISLGGGGKKTFCCPWLLVMGIHREGKKKITKEKNRSLQIPEPPFPKLHPIPQVTFPHHAKKAK